jgi:hypothetical protein
LLQNSMQRKKRRRKPSARLKRFVCIILVSFSLLQWVMQWRRLYLSVCLSVCSIFFWTSNLFSLRERIMSEADESSTYRQLLAGVGALCNLCSLSLLEWLMQWRRLCL